MKNKKILLLIALMWFVPLSVKAVVMEKFPIRLNGSYQWVTKLYKENGVYHIPTSHSAYTQFFALDRKAAYCIDFGTSLGGSVGSTQSSWGSPQTMMDAGTLQAYLTNAGTTNVSAVINKLNLIYYYGYHADLTGKTETQALADYQSFLATQALIWETLSEHNMYASLDKKQMNDIYTEEELTTMFAEKDSNGFGRLTDIGGYKVDPSDWPNIPPTAVVDNRIVDGVASIKQTITSSITAAKYDTLPSICGKTYNIEVGKSQTLTDTNGVLSKFNTTCGSGVSCSSISNNKLTITAGDSPKTGVSVTLIRTFDNVGVSDPHVYRVVDGGQGVVTLGSPAAKQCTLTVNVTAAPEPVPGCWICGDGTNEDDYHYANSNEDPGNTVGECVFHQNIEEANCKPEEKPVCWICTNSAGEKQYSFSVASPGKLCDPYPEIEEANCKPEPVDTEPPESNSQTSGLRIAYISLLCGMAAAIGFVYFYSKKPMGE